MDCFIKISRGDALQWKVDFYEKANTNVEHWQDDGIASESEDEFEGMLVRK